VSDRGNSGARWRRVGEIFEAALETPRSRLDAFLADSCAGDAELEAEVRSLLESHDAARDFLAPGDASIAIRDVSIPEAPSLEGGSIGSWRVLRAIGEGGMGMVYLAEREDGGFRQRGALKLIRHGVASEEMIRRFRRERQILATLDHPGIARLLDGGTTPDGLPWLVMEYVDGKSLYDWCSEKSLSLALRLRLFLSICTSVQAAHQRLVLHRDIKPGNILVTEDGSARLLDFGVAKIFSDGTDAGADTQDLRTIALPLTPEYASPEQVRGEEVTTASDIYSLGVLLYELVTGARPYPTRVGGAHDMLRAVLEQDPPRPSTAVATAPSAAAPTISGGALPATGSAPASDKRTRRALPAPPPGGTDSLRRKLSGDLDNIVLRAMSKEANRRYASAEHLAEDVRRFLDGRPVAARAATWSYRAEKFVRRNRLAVAAASVAVVALVGGLIATSWQAAIASRERAAAERRSRDIQSLANALLFDVHDSLATLPGTTPVREMVVTRATEFLDRVAADAGADSASRFALGDAYARLGVLQGQVWAANVGKSGEAYESLEKSRAIRESLLADYPNDERAIYGVMQACTRIGLFDLEHGREDKALAMLERGIECCRKAIVLFPDSLFYQRTLPRCLHNLGLAYVQSDRIEEGLAAMDEGIRAFGENAQREPSVAAHRLGEAQSSMGFVDALLLRPGNTDSALAIVQRAMTTFDELAREDSSDTDLRRRFLSGYYKKAQIYSFRMERADSALANVLRVSEGLEALVARDPGNEDLMVSLAIARATEGHFRAMAGQTGDAQSALAPAIAQLEAWAREDTTDTRFPQSLAEAYLGLGLVESNRGRAARGTPAARESWLAARHRLERARALHEQIAGKGSGDLPVEEGERIARALAACDSALAAH
jgi:eukaryotic-like serine/threonine-protein kinase